MVSVKVVVYFLVLAVLVAEAAAFNRFQWMAHKSALARSAEFIREARKRSEENTSGGLMCYRCHNSDPTSSWCSGSPETCSPGAVCASIFHSDNTNLDGCLPATICRELQKSEDIFVHCCSTNFCNM